MNHREHDVDEAEQDPSEDFVSLSTYCCYAVGSCFQSRTRSCNEGVMKPSGRTVDSVRAVLIHPSLQHDKSRCAVDASGCRQACHHILLSSDMAANMLRNYSQPLVERCHYQLTICPMPALTNPKCFFRCQMLGDVTSEAYLETVMVQGIGP